MRWRPLPEILERIVSVVFDTIAVERTFLLLVDEATGEPIPRVARHRDGTVLTEATLSRTVVRRVIDDRVAALASDAALETQFASARSVQEGHIRSFMCTPLWNHNAVIGVLYADNPHTAQLTTADLDVLQALSSYAAVAIEQARLTARIVEEARQRELLQRYHSAAVVEKILASPGGADAALVAEERDVSILFADIVGFTSRAERMTPSAVAELLNQCLGELSEAVFAEEGTLDKFIGDAVLAVFGAPLTQADHASRALRAAAVDAPAGRVHSTCRRPSSCGLPSTPAWQPSATSGLPGGASTQSSATWSTRARDWSRAECAPGQILLTAATRERLDRADGLRAVGCVPLRGRGAPVDVFAYERLGES